MLTQERCLNLVHIHQKRILLACTLLLVFFIWTMSDNIARVTAYFYQTVEMMSWEESRLDTQFRITAEDEWTLHSMNMKYFKSECTAADDNPRYAWITALNNDKYAIPTLVLGYMLEKLSCITTKIVLVSDQVSSQGRLALEAVGFEVRVTEGLDCNYMDKLYDREERNKGISGTHTRLLVFNMTEYDKLIYLDSDYFPTAPIDTLFDSLAPQKVAVSYGAPHSTLDPGFNAGLVGLVPETSLYLDIMAMWKEMSAVDCPDDQRLLWWFFTDRNNWIPLSYSFNVRRKRYFPMRSFHFARSGSDPRPWEWTSRPSDKELLSYDRPLHTVNDIIKLWWKYLLTAIEEKELHTFWKSVQHFTK